MRLKRIFTYSMGSPSQASEFMLMHGAQSVTVKEHEDCYEIILGYGGKK